MSLFYSYDVGLPSLQGKKLTSGPFRHEGTVNWGKIYCTAAGEQYAMR